MSTEAAALAALKPASVSFITGKAGSFARTGALYDAMSAVLFEVAAPGTDVNVALRSLQAITRQLTTYGPEPVMAARTAFAAALSAAFLNIAAHEDPSDEEHDWALINLVSELKLSIDIALTFNTDRRKES